MLARRVCASESGDSLARLAKSSLFLGIKSGLRERTGFSGPLRNFGLEMREATSLCSTMSPTGLRARYLGAGRSLVHFRKKQNRKLFGALRKSGQRARFSLPRFSLSDRE